MSILKSWKSYRRNRIIMRHYGTLNPSYANVIGGTVPVCVDPSDGRARKILLLDSVRGRDRPNQAFWFFMLKAYMPTCCIDIGLNYGECLLAGRIPRDTNGYGFEANPRLKSFVDKTLENHPDSERIQIIYSPVADKPDLPVTLRVNPDWSGGSFISKDGADPGYYPDAIEMKTVTVDDSVPQLESLSRLLFKIDVEGFEPAAFIGMARTIESSDHVVGFAEFSPQVMAQRGMDIDSYWRFLSDHFTIYMCSGRGKADLIGGDTWPEANQIINGKHTDLILMGGFIDEDQQELLAKWRELV